MRELIGGKNTIGRKAAVLESPVKRPLPFTFNTASSIVLEFGIMELGISRKLSVGFSRLRA